MYRYKTNNNYNNYNKTSLYPIDGVRKQFLLKYINAKLRSMGIRGKEINYPLEQKLEFLGVISTTRNLVIGI